MRWRRFRQKKFRQEWIADNRNAESRQPVTFRIPPFLT
jgi:hypothetical protein